MWRVLAEETKRQPHFPSLKLLTQKKKKKKKKKSIKCFMIQKASKSTFATGNANGFQDTSGQQNKTITNQLGNFKLKKKKKKKKKKSKK